MGRGQTAVVRARLRRQLVLFALCSPGATSVRDRKGWGSTNRRVSRYSADTCRTQRPVWLRWTTKTSYRQVLELARTF